MDYKWEGWEGESRMTLRFLAELLGRWGCHLQRWETGGGGTAGGGG